MTYVMAFIAAVPTANQDAYRQHADHAAEYFGSSYGVRRSVEGWGDDVPTGTTTDLYRAVAAKDGETVVFAWQEYPDAAAANAANERMNTDPAMEDMGKSMPFDASRMIFGGFEGVIEEGTGQGTYIDGSVSVVPTAEREQFVAVGRQQVALIRAQGALRTFDGWGELIPDGTQTDFKRAVAARPDETVVFSFIEWPDKSTRDKAWNVLYPQLAALPMIDDGKRRIYGGFTPIVDR